MVFFTEFTNVERACSLFGGNEQKLQKDIEKLQKWLKEQKHLSRNTAEHLILEKFVLGGKGDLNKSILKLDTYFTVKNFLPELFQKRDPQDPEMLASNDYMYMGFLPGLTTDGARVFIVAPKNNDSSKFELRPTCMRAFNLFDVWMRMDPHNNKLYVVADCRHGTIGHMMKISLSMMKNIIFCLQDAYPISVLGIIFINMIPFVRVVVEKGLKPLFKQKLAKRFLLCGDDLSELNEKIPLSMLPQDYGGSATSAVELNQIWIDVVNENRDWLITSATTPSDESLREGEYIESIMLKDYFRKEPAVPVG